MSAALIDSVGWTLLHFVWQGTLLGCATALALTALRNGQAATRYLVACAGLLACVLWPAGELLLRLRAPDVATPYRHYADILFGQGGAQPDGAMLAFVQAQLLWIVAFWASCALLLALRMGLGLLWIGRAATAPAADPAWQQQVGALAQQFGVGRPVRLRVVDDLASPLTAFWWHPVILMPASLMSGMPPALLGALLAHEMAHVRRHDYLVNLGQHAIEILLFYHPAVWWLSRRIRIEREQAADDLAAGHLAQPRQLALALSELERWQFSGHHLALAANGGDLLSRVRRLLRPQRAALDWKAALPVLGLAAACLTLLAQAQSGPALETQAPVQAHVPAQALVQAKTRTPAVADFRSCSKPAWPAASLKAQHTGTVTLGFEIDARGAVIDSTLHASSGDTLLDEAARSAIAKCRFKPATENGAPVRAWMQMRYVWLLK